jgi:integrase
VGQFWTPMVGHFSMPIDIKDYAFRKVWIKASKKAGVPYRKPYTTRHTYAAWELTLRTDPNKLVSLMGHGSKKMIYDVYGAYTKGLEDDYQEILHFFGRDCSKAKH